MTTAIQFVKDAKTHLLAQGCKSGGGANGYALCLYRSGDLKCGIGFFIPDELYNADMEDGLAAEDIYDTYPEVFKHIQSLYPDTTKDELIGLSEKIQMIHDECKPERWRELFDDLIFKINK